jgi:hypothetical protein
MVEKLRDLLTNLDSLIREIKATKAGRVSKKTILTSATSIVDTYFRSIRESLIQNQIPHDNVENCDSLMQELLELTHRRSSTQSYLSNIKFLKESILNLEKHTLLLSSLNRQISIDGVDYLIIGTLAKMIPSAALSYEQAIKDLSTNDRISWRGPATDLREALRETLDYLAPDEEVYKQEGFKFEKDLKAPTMKQKVRFILRKRGLSASASQPQEDATQAVDEAISSFVRSVYGRSNISTHTPTEKKEVLRIRDLVRAALSELLEIHT